MSKSKEKLPNDAALKAYINGCEKPPKLREIAQYFSLSPAARPALRSRLHAIATEETSQFSALDKVSSLPEIVLIEITKIDGDGTGFAVIAGQPGERQPSIEILPDNKNRRALKRGSRCLAKLKAGPEGLRGTVMRILPAQKTRTFGRVFRSTQSESRRNEAHGEWMLEPADKGGRRPLPLIPSGQTVEEDMLVEAQLTKNPRGQPVARILRILGPVGAPDTLTALAIAEFGLPHYFSNEMLEQARSASLPDSKGKDDIRLIPLVTIDGEDAKDFDDAVFAEPAANQGWRLIIAIADVAYYVGENSALDAEARLRGNSVYLPGTVIPMLPEALSNGLCSLRPEEDRACLAVEIFIDAKGKKTSHKFLRGLMRSKARLTYTQVQQVIDGLQDEEDLKVPAGTLHHLIAVFSILKKARDKRGALNLDLAEKRIIMDEKGFPAEVSLQRQLPANQLIEEMMILANICAAETLEADNHLCVFRIHDQPDPEKMDQLRELAEALDIPFAKGQMITPHRFNQVIDAAAGTRSQEAVNDAILRCQARAIYSLDNVGHYGLGLTRYAHFTSPIRRYADLLVHRQLIVACKLGDESVRLKREAAEEICRHISESEQTAAKAERRTIARLAASLMKSQLDSLVTGTITGVTHAGLFAVISGGIAEGFISRKTLPDDFYELDDKRNSLTGMYSGWRFSVGETITCRLIGASVVSGDINLRWHSGGNQESPTISRKKHNKRASMGKSGKGRRRR